ncbi:hypothetical protein M404DRAFT_180412 [Pisolithus tinctorius Marx 270]|uniref:Uncharacterized protein n=1 Tax=Pisolithus tinctorius Marx 270 TaxID=870435 RepID=A0A0C3PYD9_PISTI|nr:hypothetical protein M404DRAFT_180412 [Pisolithus tinctorius Marx 270]
MSFKYTKATAERTYPSDATDISYHWPRLSEVDDFSANEGMLFHMLSLDTFGLLVFHFIMCLTT